MDNLIIYNTGHEKQRIGKPFDGGYVICNLPEPYDCLISGGVSNDVSFEQEFLNKYPGIPCLAFDGTVNGLPTTDSRIQFIQKNLGKDENDKVTNLKETMEPYSNIFMKMDIEGHEFRLFPTFSEIQLKKIKQLVIEVHSPGDIQLHPNYFKGLSDITHDIMFDFLTKINKTHTLVHLHPNNGCKTHHVNNIHLPNVFECTFIRNEYVHEKIPNKEPLPFDIDMPNIPHLPIVNFTEYPFVVESNRDVVKSNYEVIPWLLGGLGNQMFVLAAAWVASKVNNGTLYLFNFHNDHNTLKNNYKDNIFKYFGKHIDKDQSNELMGELTKNNYKDFKQNSDGFSYYNPKDCPSQSIFIGYFQYYPSLSICENELRGLFLQGLEPLRNQITAEFGSFKSSAFLHVRRGDYLKNPHIHTLQPISYYETALSMLPVSVENIFIFSNDLDFVKEQPFFSSDPRFKVIENANELYNLAFMSLCQGGAICANSTFSWWGAFLGAYSNRAPIVVPRDWIRGHGDFSGLFPPEWIKV